MLLNYAEVLLKPACILPPDKPSHAMLKPSLTLFIYLYTSRNIKPINIIQLDVLRQHWILGTVKQRECSGHWYRI